MAFDLSSIQRGKVIKPPRIMIYGVHGIGKTTFGAGAPSPIIIPTEDGIGALDVARFPLCKSTQDVAGAIGTLFNEQHDFQTAVLDSADWLENIISREIEASHDAKDLAYGKGSVILADRWKWFLDNLTMLRDQRNMAIIMIAHTEIKRFDSPEVEPYDRYQPKLQGRSGALLQEWADVVLFANYKTLIKKDDVGFNKTSNRGITTGERLIYTEETPAYLAKNRFKLPKSLPLDWNAFSQALANSAA